MVTNRLRVWGKYNRIEWMLGKGFLENILALYVTCEMWISSDPIHILRIYFIQICCCCLVVSDSLVTPWVVAHQDPLSRQEYWSGVAFPSSGDLPNTGMEPTSPALTDGFYTPEPSGKLLYKTLMCKRIVIYGSLTKALLAKVKNWKFSMFKNS